MHKNCANCEISMSKLMRYFGPGFLVAVGYMDPGNWATDIAGGSKFEYQLLFVILISNIFAIFLQHAAIRLGIVTGLDLAEASKRYYSRPVNFILWILAEIGIIAMDLAEVLGSAIALKLLFGIPLQWGVLITAIDILLILFLFDKYYKWLEYFVAGLIAIIFICFSVELFLAKPIFSNIIQGFIPSSYLILDSEMRWIAIGILGATVMPHNLYLHSSLVKKNHAKEDKSKSIFYSTIDSTLSLSIAFFINASILILAAATFYKNGMHQVVDIMDAHKLLNPLLGVGFASILFAVALLASGQNATITGTMAGQIVMEGFVNLKIKPWLRRLITRSLAILPSWGILHFFGEENTMDILVFSQVVLSLQLGFAVFPLVYFTSNRVIMGKHVNPIWLKATLYAIALIILFFNLCLFL